MSDHDLGGYVEVGDRIQEFYEKFPEGSLQSSWQLHEIAGTPTIIVEARAYRGVDDKRPGIGLASEPVPGKTPFTKDSELMNAETSAWGRALAALGFKVKDGIASANEVRSRQGSGGGGKTGPSEKQEKFLRTLLGEDHGWPQRDVDAALTFLGTQTGGKDGVVSRTITALKSDAPTDAQNKALEWLTEHSQELLSPDEADPTSGEAYDPSIAF